MNNPMDDKLSSRIREVFEDFEDPTADAGWEELRKKYPEHNRRPLILWLSSAAALFIVAAGLWYLSGTEETIALKPRKENQALTKNEKPKDRSETEKTQLPEEIILVPSPGETLHRDDNGEEEQKLVMNPALAGTADGMESIAPREPASITLNKMVSAEDLQLLKQTSVSLQNETNFSVKPIQIDKPTFVDIYPVELELASKGEKKSVNKNKKLAFSVFAGSHFSYADGSENQLNFGAGIVSDIRLSRHLKLSTGLSIASNSLDYSAGQDVPQASISSFDSSLKSNSGNLTTITSYHARLLTLDIPLNIRFQIFPESDKLYLLTGLSSGTYLNETYDYRFRNYSTSSGSYISQTRNQEIRKQFNDFDFGRTLNLSMGWSTPLSNKQTISLEPFLKYPLGGLGSEDLKFGSTGINLKLRFNTVKK